MLQTTVAIPANDICGKPTWLPKAALWVADAVLEEVLADELPDEFPAGAEPELSEGLDVPEGFGCAEEVPSRNLFNTEAAGAATRENNQLVHFDTIIRYSRSLGSALSNPSATEAIPAPLPSRMPSRRPRLVGGAVGSASATVADARFTESSVSSADDSYT